MSAVVTFIAVWLLVVLILLTVAWMRWWWQLRRRRIARMAKRSIDKAERRLTVGWR